ncbi:MAG: FAD-binding protein [Nocardioides sp.]
MSIVDVAVVGGGIAGLAAAYRLGSTRTCSCSRAPRASAACCGALRWPG